MSSKPLYNAFLFLALICFAALCFFYFTDSKSFAAPTLIAFFSSLAFAIRRFKSLKGFSYSLWIITAVSAAMLYPWMFVGIGDFQYKLLIIPLLQVIMFGMGSQMSIKDFAGVIKMPKGVIVGVICQFTIMPIVGVGIATFFKFPPEIAAGIILIGSSPGGMASNVMSFVAKANLALSITLTAFATMLSPFLTPLLMQFFAGELIEINIREMMNGIFNIVILPICAGLIFNLFSDSKKSWINVLSQLFFYFAIIFLKNFISFSSSETSLLSELKSEFVTDALIFAVLPIFGAIIFKIISRGKKEILEKGLSFISMVGIIIIITIITAAGRESLMDVGLMLILACLLHNFFGYSLSYSTCKLLRMKEKDCRTIALEVGMQNGGLASGLALQMGKIATVGLAPAIFGPMMNITGSSLAAWWRSRKEKKPTPQIPDNETEEVKQ